jgi:hypothetical protein
VVVATGEYENSKRVPNKRERKGKKTLSEAGNGNGSGGGAGPQEGNCPVCSANASPSSDKGRAHWCQARDDGSQYDSRLCRAA